MLDGGATGRDKQLNMCAKEMLCRNIVLHKAEDSHMSQYCTMLNVIRFLPKEMWKPQIVAYYKSSRLNHNVKKLLNSTPIMELFMRLAEEHDSIWKRLRVVQKSMAELVPIDEVSFFLLLLLLVIFFQGTYIVKVLCLHHDSFIKSPKVSCLSNR